tara:strand:- start:58 stop:1197 length:1140 start_codon:yes stop_codon:yes gene_type:complete
MANQIMEKNGSYFSVNPYSKNMRELKPEELNDYLLNKRQLTPNDMEKILGKPINQISNREIAAFITDNFKTTSGWPNSEAQLNDSGEVNIDYSNPNQSLYQKAMVNLASERGAVSGMKGIDGSRGLDFARTIELPSSTDIDASSITDDEYFQTSSDVQTSPYSESINDFQAFTADQALKTQQIADNFEKYNSNSTFDAESSVNLLKDLNHEFASIDSSYLEKLHDASKSNLNFTGLNSGNAVIEAVKDMANNDRPLGESLYDESLEILDNIVMTNLKQMKRVGDIFGESVGYRRVVKPAIEMVSKFGENMGNVIDMGAEKLASKMAAQDPVTNKLPPLYLTDEEFKQQYMNDDAQLQEGFEETFQNTYGGMPELKKLEE